MKHNNHRPYFFRFYFIILLLILGLIALIFRMIYLNIINRSFLLKQSQARIMRTVNIPAYRGMILDRNGIPLAVSTPVDAIWANPQIFQATYQQLLLLAKQIDTTPTELKNSILKNRQEKKEFMYLARGLPPEQANDIKDLHIQGIFYERQYRRYYPEGPVTAHVIGFTNVDDEGQEGLELAYNQWLQGLPGIKKVLKDRLGHVVGNLALIRAPKQGHNLILSMDSRIQYLAYRILRQTIKENNAEAGSVVILNVKTGEILAMVNQPSYNPNKRSKIHDSRFRNRAVTDTFEPGSTMKAFSVAAALNSGTYTPDTLIETSPGWIVIDGHTFNDDGNYGTLTLGGIVKESSNVGTAKITLSLPPENLWNMLWTMGFGQRTDSGFPGEASGTLIKRRIWRPIDLSTFSFGYGISVTALQLAHAYAIIAAHGVNYPITFLKLTTSPQGHQVLSQKISDEMISILEMVLQKGGTGTEARVLSYTVAGKTGTAYIAGPAGYDLKNLHYTASFVGFAPASDPQFVVAVVIRDPRGEHHFGARVAAPAFAKIMGGCLQLMGIPPDALKQNDQLT